jgi:NAD(P)-dependent dehydrogenase (short-subunit alcohol dehydrogenase family)
MNPAANSGSHRKEFQMVAGTSHKKVAQFPVLHQAWARNLPRHYWRKCCLSKLRRAAQRDDPKQFGAMEDFSIADARYQFGASLFGAARLTQLVLPAMRNKQAGIFAAAIGTATSTVLRWAIYNETIAALLQVITDEVALAVPE